MSNSKCYRKKICKYIDLYGTINMTHFLQSYAGVSEQVYSLKRATHKDIKLLAFDGVVSVPFEILDNDDLAMGNVILVVDCMNNLGAYKNPLRMDNIYNKPYIRLRERRKI